MRISVLEIALALMAWAVRTPALPGLDCKEIEIEVPGTQISANSNSTQNVKRELLDRVIFHRILSASQLTEADANTVTIADKPGVAAVVLCRTGEPQAPFRLLQHTLWLYCVERSEGHSTDYIVAALTNRARPAVLPDNGILAIVDRFPTLPVTLLTKWETGAYTNRAGQEVGKTWTGVITNGEPTIIERANILKENQIVNWARYILRDGEIAWLYHVNFDPSLPKPSVTSTVRDAKEFDSKYRDLFRKFEADVRDEMRHAGSDRLAGSPRTFIRLMKDRLKAHGIEWRSPEELNPRESGAVEFR